MSEIVRFHNLDIIVVSPHQRLGYIWFDTISPTIEQRLEDIASSKPAVRYDTLQKRIESTGDNVTFRNAVLEIAHALK